MHPSELLILDIMRRHVTVHAQFAQAYMAEQNKLQLELVLTPDRMHTQEGTDLSLAALRQMDQLTAAHHQAFQKFILAASSEVAAAMDGMPDDMREALREKMLSTVQWQMEAQSRFYPNRLRWIAAATAVCELVQAKRDEVTFSDDGIDFLDDDDLRLFATLMETVEETHRADVAVIAERVDRMKNSMAAVGMLTRQ
jgi:hypothetical protein